MCAARCIPSGCAYLQQVLPPDLALPLPLSLLLARCLNFAVFVPEGCHTLVECCWFRGNVPSDSIYDAYIEQNSGSISC